MKLAGLLLILLVLSGCTHPVLVSEAENIWVHDKSRDTFTYCKANRTDKGATPVCYPAAFVDRASRELTN